MKKSFKLGIALLLLIALSSLDSDAQNASGGGSGIRYSIGVETGIPAGSLNYAYKWNLGGSIQADIPVIEQLYVTVNAGYNNIFVDKDVAPASQDIHLIPAKAGLKYFILPVVYVQGEAGVAFLTNKSRLDDSKSAAFVYAPQAGILFPVGDSQFIDAGLRFESNSKFTEGGKKSNFFGLRLAYAFGI